MAWLRVKLGVQGTTGFPTGPLILTLGPWAWICWQAHHGLLLAGNVGLACFGFGLALVTQPARAAQSNRPRQNTMRLTRAMITTLPLGA